MSFILVCVFFHFVFVFSKAFSFWEIHLCSQFQIENEASQPARYTDSVYKPACVLWKWFCGDQLADRLVSYCVAAAAVIVALVGIAIVVVLFVQSIKHTDSYDLFSQSLVFTSHSILMKDSTYCILLTCILWPYEYVCWFAGIGGHILKRKKTEERSFSST